MGDREFFDSHVCPKCTKAVAAALSKRPDKSKPLTDAASLERAKQGLEVVSGYGQFTERNDGHYALVAVREFLARCEQSLREESNV